MSCIPKITRYLKIVDHRTTNPTFKYSRIDYLRTNCPWIDFPGTYYPRTNCPRINYPLNNCPRISFPRILHPRNKHPRIKNSRIKDPVHGLKFCRLELDDAHFEEQLPLCLGLSKASPFLKIEHSVSLSWIQLHPFTFSCIGRDGVDLNFPPPYVKSRIQLSLCTVTAHAWYLSQAPR